MTSNVNNNYFFNAQSNELEKKFKLILNGHFLKEDIGQFKLNSNLIRIFLSSTFNDTHPERDYLTAKIYPKLRKQINEKYGLDFMIIDLRWGVPSTFTKHEFKSSEILISDVCFNEIRICQKISNGPNFVAFLSERYGHRMLPSEISDKEFTIIVKEIERKNYKANFDHSPEALKNKYLSKMLEKIHKNPLVMGNLVKKCYSKNENVEPNVYELINIKKMVEFMFKQNSEELLNQIELFNEDHFDKSLNEKSKKIYKDLTAEIKNQLQILIRDVVSNLEKKIHDFDFEKYFVSVTEREIHHGILSYDQNEYKTCVFYRSIIDKELIDLGIKKEMNLASKYFDINNGKINGESFNLITDLRRKIMLKHGDVIDLKPVRWNKNSGISYNEHKSYFEDFGNLFETKILEMIDLNIKKDVNILNHAKNDFTADFISESIQQANFRIKYESVFLGRNREKLEIEKYIKSTENNKPFFIFGNSGTGKTSFLANIANKFSKSLDISQTSIITFFLGTTAFSSSISRVLKHIIYSIASLFNGTLVNEEILNKDFTSNELKSLLQQLLVDIQTKYPKNKIIILIDAIDQLKPKDLENLNWILKKIPSNTKMIYSILNEYANTVLFEKICKIMRFSSSDSIHCLELKNLDLDTSIEMLELSLINSKRKLSKQQREVIIQLFENISQTNLTTLFVKLIFDIAKKWSSWYVFPKDDFIIKLTSAKETIKFIFREIEFKYGKFLFSRIVFYINCFNNGICESELEDILSLDDDVLLSLSEFTTLPVRRFPIGIWARIKYDLKEYITIKEMDDVQVINWYHRKFIEVSNEMYVDVLSNNEKDDIIINAIEYFTERWNHEEKLFIFNDTSEDEYYIVGKEKRNTKIQPIETNLKLNKRKLSELPSLIMKLSNSDLKFNLLKDEIYANFKFMQAKAKLNDFDFIFKANEQIYDKIKNKANIKLRDLFILGNVYLDNSLMMQKYPKTLHLQLQSRLLDYYDQSIIISKLIDQCDAETINSPNEFTPIVILNSYLPIINNFKLKNLFYSEQMEIEFIASYKQLLLIVTQDINNIEVSLINMINSKKLDTFQFSTENGKVVDFVAYFDELFNDFNPKFDEINGGCVFLTDKSNVIHFNFEAKLDFFYLTHECLKKIKYLGNKLILMQALDNLKMFCLENRKFISQISFTNEIFSVLCNNDSNKIFFSNSINKTTLIVINLEYLRVFKIRKTETATNFSEIASIQNPSFGRVNLVINNAFYLNKNINFIEIAIPNLKNDEIIYLKIQISLKPLIQSSNIKVNSNTQNLNQIKLLDFQNDFILYGFGSNTFIYDKVKNVIACIYPNSQTCLFSKLFANATSCLFIYANKIQIRKFELLKNKFILKSLPSLVFKVDSNSYDKLIIKGNF